MEDCCRLPWRTEHRSYTALLIGLVGLCLLSAAPVQGQTGDCRSTGSDVFAAARQGRRVVADYERLRRVHLDDMARNAALYRQQTGRDMPWSFGVAGIFDYTSTFGFGVCTNQGDWTGTLTPYRLGAISHLSLGELGLQLETFVMHTIDNLRASPTPGQTRTADGGYRDATGELASASAHNTLYGGRITIGDKLTVVGGYIESGEVASVPGNDGRELVVDGLGSSRAPRLYLGAGVPRYDLFVNLLLDERDAAADRIALGAGAVALPWAGLVGSAAVGYIADEAQATASVGVHNLLRHISLEASTEHRPFRLRHARARVDWGWSWGIEPDELRQQQPAGDARPRFAFDLGTFAELSWFGSRWLAEHAGRSHAWGTYMGAFARPDFTVFMARFDFYLGINRPDELETISNLAGHWQVGVRLHGRFGL